MSIKQPKNISYKGGGVTAEVKWPSDFADKHNAKMDRAKQVLKSEYLRNIYPYMPMGIDQGSGGLIKRTQISNASGPIDEVIFPGPSSRMLDEGYVMEGTDSGKAWANKGEKKKVREPKQDLKFHGAPKRGAHWNERMEEEKGEQIRESVSKAYKEG